MTLERHWLKNKIACSVLLLIVAACMLTGCQRGTEVEDKTLPSEEPVAAASVIPNETGKSRISEDDLAQKEAENIEGDSQEDNKAGKRMRFYVNDEEISVTWEDNESVEALKEMVLKEPLVIEMSMYGGFEQVGSIGQSLPRNDQQTMTDAGDIVLYSGNQIVVFYGANSWSYTRLGHIEEKTKKEISQLLGEGNVSLTIRVVE